LTMRAIPERLRDASCGGAIRIDYLYLIFLKTRISLLFLNSK